MRIILTNLWFLIILAVIIVGFGIALSVCKSDLKWLGLSGSIITLIAVILNCRKLIRLGYKNWKESKRKIDYGHIEPTPEGNKECKSRGFR